MHEVFYWLFNMSITATVAGLLVLLVRSARRIPRRLATILWLIPLARLVLPFGLGSKYSLMSLLTEISTRTVVVYPPKINDITLSYMNSVALADDYFPITYKYNVLEDVFGIAAAVWATVATAILLTLAVLYVTTLRETGDAMHFEENIYFSDKIVSPAVYGIFKPRILLPASYKSRDVELIVLHEREHIRHLDNLWRLLAFAVTAIHWFNPFCWLFLKHFLSDLELSCDERVLKRIGHDRAREYAGVLLESKQGVTLFASAFGGARIRTRIENIHSFKKMTWLSATVFTIFLIAMFYVLLTNAV